MRSVKGLEVRRVDNPYLDDFESLQEEHGFKGQQWFGHRQKLVEEYGWAVPNEEAIDYLTQFDETIVEVGAGKGYWAYLIDQNGGSIEAYDIDPPDDTYYNVMKRNSKTLKSEIVGSPLLLVWPPADSMMDFDCIKSEPNHILYVGEPRGGCTGSDKFFEIFEEEYGHVRTIDIPSYAGVRDTFGHYVRKDIM